MSLKTDWNELNGALANGAGAADVAVARELLRQAVEELCVERLRVKAHAQEIDRLTEAKMQLTKEVGTLTAAKEDLTTRLHDLHAVYQSNVLDLAEAKRGLERQMALKKRALQRARDLLKRKPRKSDGIAR